MSAFQLADKGISTIKMTKSFRPPFSKGGAVEAAEASSCSAEHETPLRRFLLLAFLCAHIAKEKRQTFTDVFTFLLL
jgi:hypothetical protein